MKIYTKTGDEGTTGLFGGGRVRKDDARVEAYGTVDELNSIVGLARAVSLPGDVEAVLAGVQEDLFVIGAELATVAGKEEKLPMELLSDARAALLEGAIDRMEETLPPLKTFVMPGGSPGGAHLHQARTVCRRAERRVLGASRETPIRKEVLVYLNRLSDYLFVAARRANHVAKTPDVPWAPRKQGEK
ncbi:MAG TPA: cob(I)yrinic acid a,c-diamide adenosyltransferase [Polyangiaceae bacterium]|jgi:cob(I)alamin adenosyltransferase|nr:cob(I)yrinic acid a,c-diamide adenosyltransferase [Polyangiaceae bacterium]